MVSHLLELLKCQYLLRMRKHSSNTFKALVTIINYCRELYFGKFSCIYSRMLYIHRKLTWMPIPSMDSPNVVVCQSLASIFSYCVIRFAYCFLKARILLLYDLQSVQQVYQLTNVFHPRYLK